MVQVICERYATLGWFRATSKEVRNESLALIVANSGFVSTWSSLVWLVALFRVAQVVVLVVSMGNLFWISAFLYYIKFYKNGIRPVFLIYFILV